MRISRFILNSDYATLKNDAEGELSITLPDTVRVVSGNTSIYHAEIDLGAKPSAAWRVMAYSTKYNNLFGYPSSSFSIPADKSTPNYGPEKSFGAVEVYRVGGKFRVDVRFYGPDSSEGSYAEYTNIAQTLTFRIQSFIDPFNTEM